MPVESLVRPDAHEDAVAAIEDAFVAHWSVFGRWAHGSLHDEDGVVWFETPIRALPYNMVMRTRVANDVDATKVVDRIASGFRARGVPYLWVVRPSDNPPDLAALLARQGLDLVERVTGMDLDLASWKPGPANPAATIVTADHDPAGLREYVELIRTYWSVPESEQHLLEQFNDEWSGPRTPGIRLLARVDNHAVGKLFLNTTEAPERVAVYGVAVKPEARGYGVATALMSDALVRARALGAQRCVLHSSDMAVALYRRMGFVEHCEFEVYATAPLFGTHHH